MRAVVQRVFDAKVTVDGAVSGSIDRGLLVYLGVAKGDTEKEAVWMAEKAVNLRIFPDAAGVMNLSLLDILNTNGKSQTDGKCKKTGILAVSQFTLLADARKGRRPYYGEAAGPEYAEKLYQFFMNEVRARGVLCEAGIFQTHMDVSYTNSGPVTIILDSRPEDTAPVPDTARP